MKKCPNCGTEITTDTKFCTHCGYDLTQKTSQKTTEKTVTKETATKETTESEPKTTTATTTNDQVQQLQNKAKNYFGWVLNSWKQPTIEQPAESYFSYISFVIEALLMTLTAVIIGNHLLTTLNTSQSYLQVNKLTFGTDLKIFMCVLIGMIFYLGAGYVVSLLGNRGSKVHYTTYMNRYAQLTNYTLVINLLLWLASFLINFSGNILVISQSFEPVLVLFSISCFAWQLGLIFVVIKSVDRPVINRVYLAFIAVLIVSLLFYFMVRLIGQDLQTQLLSRIGELSSQFSSLFGN